MTRRELPRPDDDQVERAALALLAYDEEGEGGAGPAEPLDELLRRRLINAVLTESASPSATADSDGQRAGLRQAAVALAACLLVGAGVVWWVAPTQERAPAGGAVAQRWPATQQASVVLRAGVVLVDDAVPKNGSGLHPGQTLRTGQGRAVLALPMGSRVLSADDTELRVVSLEPGRVHLQLLRGEVLASVTKRRAGQVFVVETRAGRVVVKGTLFSVTVTPGAGATVQVLKGQVRVEHAGGALDLARGQIATLGAVSTASRARPLDPAEWTRLRRQARLFALLGDGGRVGAAVKVSSTPTGATVTLNGTKVGRTPLLTALRPGARKLTIRREGYAPIREQVRLQTGDVVLRNLTLAQNRPTDTRDAQSAQDKRVDRWKSAEKTPRLERAADQDRVVDAESEKSEKPERFADLVTVPKAGQDAAARFKLRKLARKTGELKEQVLRTKGKLRDMQAALMDGYLAGATLAIQHESAMGQAFSLVQLAYHIDGKRVFFKRDPSGALNARRPFVAHTGQVSPGQHTVSVHLVYRGSGYGLFPYFRGYRFDVRSSQTVSAAAGRRTLLKVRAHPKGDFTTKVEDLPAVSFELQHRRLTPKNALY
jgi:PEGA domain/FecR protein